MNNDDINLVVVTGLHVIALAVPGLFKDTDRYSL